MKQESKKEIIVIIISSSIVALLTVVMGIINIQKEVQQVIYKTPDLDRVNFIEYFGLKKGKEFFYEVYQKEYSSSHKSKFEDTIFNRKIRVVDEYQINNGTLFVLNGDITNPEDENEEQGILIVSNIIYRISPQKIKLFINAAKQISDLKDFWGLESAEELFTLPFFDGKKFNEDVTQYFRPDNQYQYYVQKEGSSSYYDGEKIIEVPRYRIYYITLSDNEFYEFLPYVGITHKNYHHNGTFLERNISLVEVKNP